jgi:hypothetical protein
MKLVSTSHLTIAIHLVRLIFVCYACICAFDLLPQKAQIWIFKNYINVFLYRNKIVSAYYSFMTVKCTRCPAKLLCAVGHGRTSQKCLWFSFVIF